MLRGRKIFLLSIFFRKKNLYEKFFDQINFENHFIIFSRLKYYSKHYSLALDFKPSNIRIWIHNRDIGKLQQVLWEGHGNKLRMETSNNPRVKRFLEAVPFIMVCPIFLLYRFPIPFSKIFLNDIKYLRYRVP